MTLLLKLFAITAVCYSTYRSIMGCGFLLNKKANRRGALIFAGGFVVIIPLWSFLLNDWYPLLYLIVIAYSFYAVKITYNEKWRGAIISTLFYLIQELTVLYLFLAIFTLANSSAPGVIYANEFYHDVGLIIAATYICLVTVFFKSDVVVQLFNMRNYKRSGYYNSMIILETVLMLLLLFIQTFFFQKNYNGWASLLVTIVCLITIIAVYALVYLVYLYQNELQRQLVMQYEARHTEQLLAHYNSYEDYTKSLQVFRHDYKKMMGTINVLLKEGNITKAQSLIREINDMMGRNIDIHKQYSNNKMLDALLQETDNRCSNIHAAYEAMLYLPACFESDIRFLIEIFSVIIDNAIRAIGNVPDETKRYFKITSQVDNAFLLIIFTNPYDNEIITDEGGTPIPNFKRPKTYGIGLKGLENRVEAIGGSVT